MRGETCFWCEKPYTKSHKKVGNFCSQHCSNRYKTKVYNALSKEEQIKEVLNYAHYLMNTDFLPPKRKKKFRFHDYESGIVRYDKKNLYKKKCKHCSVEFGTSNPRVTTCGDDCARIHHANLKRHSAFVNVNRKFFRSKLGEACQECGETNSLEFHHAYYPDKVLDVGDVQKYTHCLCLLCMGCHKKKHKHFDEKETI